MISALLFFQDNFNAWINTAPDDNATASLPSPTIKRLEIPPKEQPTEMVSATPPAMAKDSTASDAAQNLPSDDPAVILAQMYGDKNSDDDINTALRAVDAIPDDEGTPGVASSSETATEISPAPTVTPTIAPKTVEPVQPPTVAEKPITAKPITPKTSPDSTQRHTVPADLPGQRRDWILKQNPKHYTLQLVAGNDIKTLRAFNQQHSLSKPLAVYRSTRKGKPWFGLIHGIYPSKQQAIDARSRLSKTLRRVKPWVRELAPLQKELR